MEKSDNFILKKKPDKVQSPEKPHPEKPYPRPLPRREGRNMHCYL